MRRRVLDTNKLLRLWKGHGLTTRQKADARSPLLAAELWLKKYKLDGILSPVRLEFLGGTHGDKLKLAEEFLAMFPVFEERKILPADWLEAERLAKRVPPSGAPRGAVDCLLAAIATRLNAEFETEDTGARALRNS